MINTRHFLYVTIVQTLYILKGCTTMVMVKYQNSFWLVLSSKLMGSIVIFLFMLGALLHYYL